MSETAAAGAVLRARAPAKVNLTLHVLGRRADGFHALESLVVFAGVADHLSLRPGGPLSLVVDGPKAGAAGPTDDNLVLRAARALAERRADLTLGSFRLTKRLPAAAGIGGGSSDAAAALRLLAQANGLALNDADVVASAQATGADVPVCLDPRARMMRGLGEEVGPPLALPAMFAVLVNPGVAVPTRSVFRALGLSTGQEARGAVHPAVSTGTSDVLSAIAQARNDLEPPAIALAPQIATALDRLRATSGCRLVRMSGSGATVFGLYADRHAAAQAAGAIRRAEPQWWVTPTVLR